MEEKNEGPTTTKGERRKWIRGRGEKGRGTDLQDQCQTTSYAPVECDSGPMHNIDLRFLYTTRCFFLYYDVINKK